MKKDMIDSFTKQELFELLLMLNDKLNIIESEAIDNKKLLVQLVKQNNSLVKFLANLEIEEVSADEMYPPPEEFIGQSDYNKTSIYDILKELSEKTEELKEFEKELKKHKDKLTPGQVGES